ncbi:MAG: response regulator transcription factor [Saprospiraceae bacterium]|nr:response regulator transcription factor [Bacteroidia bacterium]MBT8229627.1 response regulator transcription factor [Bacteroidia bacterium]NNF23106.1 response regulator transcription factor [Saprospiraceae bacterium]NNK89928.1 response regulator transcription factor [Saprospiraceae bacterium]
MDKGGRILIVEDEKDIVEFLEYNLRKEGYEIEVAYDGLEGFKKAVKFNPHLILLDIMMPEMDGIELCEKIRKEKQFNDTLIAFLTARSESFTQITALDIGGDDFISKPIKPNLLLSRIKALLRRHPELKKNGKSHIYIFDDLKINTESYTVKKSGKKIKLAKKEFELLALLISKPGKVFKREEILLKVWGNDVIVGDRTIDVHIRKLREKLGSHYIQTMKGVGYKFDF